MNELERAGYIRRRQTTDAQGKFSGNEYIIYERPADVGDAEAEPQKQLFPGEPSLENMFLQMR